MKDRGFNENPSWLTYASSLAKENAVKLNISEDEALQNLRKMICLFLELRITNHSIGKIQLTKVLG